MKAIVHPAPKPLDCQIAVTLSMNLAEAKTLMNIVRFDDDIADTLHKQAFTLDKVIMMDTLHMVYLALHCAGVKYWEQ